MSSSMMPPPPNTPAGIPPPGVVPNFVNPYSRAYQATDSGAVIMAIMLAFVFLRIYARAIVVKQFGADDWACVAAAIITVGYTCLAFSVLASGTLGVHQWNLTIGQFNTTYFNRLIASQTIYPCCTMAIKLSIFLLYRRIFGTSGYMNAKVMIWFGAIVCSLFYIITFILTLVWCAPPPGESPKVSAAAYSCQTEDGNVAIVQAGFNMVSDLYLLAIPLPIVWNLRLSASKKLGVCAIFLTGLLATVCSILTMYYRLARHHTKDAAWEYVPIYIVSLYELNVGIICSCMPCIPILFRSESMKHLLSLASWARLSSVFTRDVRSQGKASKDSSPVRGDGAGFTRVDSSTAMKDPSSLEMGDYPTPKPNV